MPFQPRDLAIVVALIEDGGIAHDRIGCRQFRRLRQRGGIAHQQIGLAHALACRLGEQPAVEIDHGLDAWIDRGGLSCGGTAQRKAPDADPTEVEATGEGPLLDVQIVQMVQNGARVAGAGPDLGIAERERALECLLRREIHGADGLSAESGTRFRDLFGRGVAQRRHDEPIADQIADQEGVFDRGARPAREIQQHRVRAFGADRKPEFGDRRRVRALTRGQHQWLTADPIAAGGRRQLRRGQEKGA